MTSSTETTDVLDKASAETGFSRDAVGAMAEALADGGGAMAQFDHPEFGGRGQWMRGGMVMTGSFGDHALKARIDRLCAMLAASPRVLGRSPQRGAQHQQQSSGPRAAADLSHGWPFDLGRPDVTGSQDDVHYAWFAAPRRLVIESGGRVTVYDTADHRIGGVSQQQGDVAGLTFTSQHGPVALDRLAIVSGEAASVAQRKGGAPAEAQRDPIAAIERLSALHARGVLDDDEFRAKKAELLARI